MQDISAGLAQPSAEWSAGGHGGAAVASPYRRVQPNCNDQQFVAALNAFRASGGLAPAEELLVSFNRRGGHGLATLARWIVARQVVSFVWQARTWLPLFQWTPDDMTPRRDLAPVLATLNVALGDWEAVQWFATPNAWLAGCTPVSMVQADLPAVLLAARAVVPLWEQREDRQGREELA